MLFLLLLLRFGVTRCWFFKSSQKIESFSYLGHLCTSSQKEVMRIKKTRNPYFQHEYKRFCPRTEREQVTELHLRENMRQTSDIEIPIKYFLIGVQRWPRYENDYIFYELLKNQHRVTPKHNKNNNVSKFWSFLAENDLSKSSNTPKLVFEKNFCQRSY